MTSTRRLIYGIMAVITALALMAAALPASPSRRPDQRATRTPRANPAVTLTALQPTVAAGATRLAPTLSAGKATAAALATMAAATATARRLTATPPAKVSAEEASAAITAYADEILGLSVKVTQAGGLTGTINRTLTQTTAGSSAQSLSAKGAAKTYGAILSNGAASLSYGTGTVTGDVTVDVQGSSLGIYSLKVTNTGTLDAAQALQLAQATFPGVGGLEYTVYTVTKGFAWYAKGTSSGVDLKTKKVVTFAQAVVLYVLPAANGQASVSATVGRGELAANLKVP